MGAMRNGIALCVATLLSACGGGGGGGGDASSGSTAPPVGVPPPAGGGGTLGFNLANAGRVAGYPLWSSEMVVRLAQLVSDDVATPAGSGTSTCAITGQLQRVWTDRDSSGTLSAGDEISLVYAGCSRDPLTRAMDGRVTVALISAATNGGFEARVTLPEPGVAIGYTTGLPGRSDFRITGQMRLAVSHSALRRTFAVGDGADDALSIGFPGSAVGPDRMTALRISKAQHWDEARTYLELQMRYESPELGGSYEVATTTPLKAWLDTLPEPNPQQGEIRMRGRGGDELRIQVAGAGGTTPSDFGGWLDVGGDGVREGELTGRWIDAGVVTGVFFADYSPGGRGNAFAYDPNEFSLRRPVFPADAMPVDGSLVYRFTRPVADTTGWRWRLLDKGRLDDLPTIGTEVPVQAEVQGAVITVRPANALRYSRRYQLLVDTGTSSGGGQQMRATTGGTLSVYGGVMAEFSTPNFLNTDATLLARPNLKAGEPLEIAAVAPPSGAPPSLRYLWTQLDGTPLAIAQPTARSTLVSLPAGARGVGTATLRLTVSLDGAGNSESRDYVLRTVGDIGAEAWATRLRVPSNLESWFTPVRELWTGPAVGALVASVQGDRLNLAYNETADPAHTDAPWSLELRSADGQPLQVGRYANAYSSTWFMRPAGVPTLDLVSGMYRPSSVQGEFVIHELETDAGGRITRLALDFVAPQSNTGPVTSSGSVRINSARALPP